MIFVDTSAWFARSVSLDPNHGAAKAWLLRNHQRLVTTDYVLDETLTLFRARGEYRRGVEWGAELLAEEIAELEWVSATDIAEAWEIYHKFRDKAWSFTDCVSRVVMARLKIKCAFAFDRHFREFGTVHVVP